MGAARAVAAWGGRGEAWLPRPPTPPRVYPARAHTLPSHHTHLGRRHLRTALAPGAVRRNGIPGVCRVMSGVVDPRGCGRPRPHAAAGTTGGGRCVCGGGARRCAAARPTPHTPQPQPMSTRPHRVLVCMARHRWSVAVCVMSCAWRGGGGREAVRPGHHTPHTACQSPRTSHSPPEHRPSTQRHTHGRPQLQPQVQPQVCRAAVVDATDTDPADTAHR